MRHTPQNSFSKLVLLNERTSTVLGSEKFRYQFNGMEVDNEVKGNGNSYTTEFRQYDPRLGRWLSLDPAFKNFPWQSPYVAFDNNPIFYKDPKGLAAEGGDPSKKAIKKLSKQADKIKKASNKLSENERKQAEKYQKKYGGDVSEFEDSKGNKRYSVNSNFTNEDGESEVSAKVFNRDKWKDLSSQKAGLVQSVMALSVQLKDNQEMLERIVYNPIPDVVGVSVGYTLVAGMGGSTSFNLIYLTNGPDEGIHFTFTAGIKYGLHADFSGNLMIGNYTGPDREVTKASLMGTGYELTFDTAVVGAGVWFSRKANGDLGWFGFSVGVGPGIGGSAGETTTW